MAFMSSKINTGFKNFVAFAVLARGGGTTDFIILKVRSAPFLKSFKLFSLDKMKVKYGLFLTYFFA